MEKYQVVPDVVRTAPAKHAEVKFPSGVAADMGNELTPTQVKDPPQVDWEAKPGAYYTLCMTDPDAPSRASPKFREWHHWLVVNIPGNDIKKGEILTEYIGAGPPQDTGLHRYVILVYEQNDGKIQFNENKLPRTSGEGRGRFSIEKFAKKYNLGNPVAGNFFQAQWDSYVPKLYAQLK